MKSSQINLIIKILVCFERRKLLQASKQPEIKTAEGRTGVNDWALWPYKAGRYYSHFTNGEPETQRGEVTYHYTNTWHSPSLAQAWL